MRTASRGPLTSLLGSLAVHACVVLALFVAAGRNPDRVAVLPQTADAWQGNAVEVDAVASPNETPDHAAAASQESGPSEPRAEAVRAPPSTRTARNPTSNVPRASRSANTAPGSHPETTATSAGSFGSEGLPLGVRSLPSALTRAIPPASAADPIWQSLPVGTQRAFILAVEVDAEGHIDSAQILGSHDGRDVPTQFEHLRQRVIALLGGGLFALQNNTAAGRDQFRITITLSDRPVRDEDAAPAELVERGFDPPRGKNPGRAYFTLASGRHFEAKVELLGVPARSARP